MRVIHCSLTAGHGGTQARPIYQPWLISSTHGLNSRSICKSNGLPGKQLNRVVSTQASHMSSDMQCSTLDERFSHIKNTLLAGAVSYTHLRAHET